MPTIAISGAGSGIGHTFVDHYGKDSNNTIHAIDVTWSDEVSDSKTSAKIIRHTVDTSKQESLDKLKKELGDKPIDLFIHSAAVRGLNNEITKKDSLPANAETLDVVQPEVFAQTLLVNTLGTFMLVRALLPNLKTAKEPKCIVMGSGMGSIANNSGGAYAYGSSKAGLNYVVKSFHHDVPEVAFAVIHPGKVDTRMTHVREEGAVDAEEAVELMLPIMDELKAGQKELMFVTRDKKDIPW
jgi:NAD(P)-dependent dehydrogenase (short-subunit alcohol dehydrogenase family)